MDIALVSGNPHLPQLVGGVEINTHELAQALIRRGHRAVVVAKLSSRDRFGLRRIMRLATIGGPGAIDRDLGYPVYRARRPWEIVARLPRFTVAVIQNARMLELAAGFTRVAVPSVAYLHGLEFEAWPCHGARPAGHLPFRGYIANSQFTAARLQRRHGVEATVVPPIFRPEQYATAASGGEVTFVNPVAVKGVDLALEIAARCPEIPFSFVLGWPLGLAAGMALRRRLRRLGNVKLRQRTADMRSVYRDTKILLAPSQWEAETWGRVVSEAQLSGIPVVASNRGGLPEAVGPGGVIVAFDAPADIWSATIRRLWTNHDCYLRLAEAALRHSRRPQLDPALQVDAFVNALERFVG